MTKLRRLYLATMSSGEVGVGLLSDHDFQTTVFRKHDPFPVGVRLQWFLADYDFDMVVASFPGAGRSQDAETNGQMQGLLIGLRCATILIPADEIQAIETDTRCNACLPRRSDYAMETVERLLIAHRAAMTTDRRFGWFMRHDDGAMVARLSCAAERIVALEHHLKEHQFALEQTVKALGPLN